MRRRRLRGAGPASQATVGLHGRTELSALAGAVEVAVTTYRSSPVALAATHRAGSNTGFRVPARRALTELWTILRRPRGAGALFRKETPMSPRLVHNSNTGERAEVLGEYGDWLELVLLPDETTSARRRYTALCHRWFPEDSHA